MKLPKEGEFAAWKKGLMTGLRERPFHAFPERIPAAANTGDSVKGQVRFGLPSPLGGPLLTTEAPLRVLLTAPANPEVQAPKEGLLIVLNPDDDATEGLPEWAAPYNADEHRPPAGAPRRQILRRMDEHVAAQLRRRADALLGRTVDEGRVRDVAATVRYLYEQDKGARTWRVAGRGQAGVIAAYAALFEPSIKEVIVVDPPASHMDGPYFLGVLRVLGYARRPRNAGADAADADRGEGQGVRQDGADLPARWSSGQDLHRAKRVNPASCPATAK